MKIVLQRVKEASVTVAGEIVSRIQGGYLLLVGIAKPDTAVTAGSMAAKIAKLRIFEDDAGKMNLDIRQVKGWILSVPQFTLLARTEKGARPGFDNSAPPEYAELLWHTFNNALISHGIQVLNGVFGAHMEVRLINDGPVTFVLDSCQG
ncbi:MAG: D-aminoacyl-tRNA deacylase [Candidatus Omnitrophota bacterium]